METINFTETLNAIENLIRIVDESCQDTSEYAYSDGLRCVRKLLDMAAFVAEELSERVNYETYEVQNSFKELGASADAESVERISKKLFKLMKRKQLLEEVKARTNFANMLD